MKSRNIIIGGILIPLVVGIILLLIEHKVFSPSSPKTDSNISKSSPKPEVKQPVRIENKDVPIEKETDLNKTFQVANKIYGTSERNKQYCRIIETAIERAELEFAFKVADDIYGTTERNTEYKEIIKAALKEQRYDLAIKMADEIYGTTERNKVYELIISERLKN